MRFDKILQIEDQKIVFAVLNWGLGHATRSSVLIRALINKNNLILLSDGIALQWLKIEFPECRHIELPSYKPHYRYSQMWLNMLCQLPHFFKTFIREKLIIKKLIKEERIDLIISDNRWGCYNTEIESIFITHQLKILHPNSMLSGLASYTNNSLIGNFDQCWIPDTPNHTFSGELSNVSTKATKTYIGILSTFEKTNSSKDIDLLIILSGPEPSRTILEIKLLAIAWPDDKNVVVIRGTNKKSAPTLLRHVDLIGRDQLNELLNRSKKCISRSGYSTVMDFLALNKKAMLIPTPRQPEQEYLAQFHADKTQFKMLAENDSDFQNKILAYLNRQI